MKILRWLFNLFTSHSPDCKPPISSQKENLLKVLHVCYHDGCVNELQAIADALSWNLTSWNIHKLPPYFYDYAVKKGNILYNLGYDRANRIWEKHKQFFDQFDVIITSDITAVARIFLQNGWTKPIILWIHSRFDFSYHGETDCDFPDKKYYDLMREARHRKNVFFVPSTPFEIYYGNQKNVDLNGSIIAACAYYLYNLKNNWPKNHVKNKQLFIHERTENVQALHIRSFRVSKFLQKMGIPATCYRYKTLEELQAFKGVLYLPYQWYIISFFEVLRLGIPIFVPSESFLLHLLKTTNYFFERREDAIDKQMLPISEWYAPAVRDIVIYFDSWEDLKNKVENLDIQAVRQKSVAYALKHQEEMLKRWKAVFEEVCKLLPEKVVNVELTNLETSS